MRVVSAVAIAIVAVAAATSADAGPQGSWTRLPGTVVNFAEPGLARTSDGVLQVLYTRKAGTKEELVHAAVSPAGAVGDAKVALGGWSSMSHPDVLRMPDGSLRAFFGGIRTTNPSETNNALNTATAPASGAQWTLQPGKAAQATYAYATSYAGAALAKDGTPISAWAGTPGLGFHYGVSPGDPDRLIPQSGCCLHNPDIGVDAASGQAWIGFSSNESASPGLFAHQIGPGGPQGGRQLAPGSTVGKSFNQQLSRAQITGRLGAAGVFLAYGQGYPTYKTVALWRAGSAKPQLVIKANETRRVALANAPEGRIWLLWELNGAIYATRTNHAATRVGPVTRLKPPGSGTVYELDGEGSAGPLDLFANDGQGLWQQQVRPRLQITASTKPQGKQRLITFHVLDAGDPVAGAKVRTDAKTLVTNARGTANLLFGQRGQRRIKVVASKAGYVSASITIR
jgi:hypothetical protein